MPLMFYDLLAELDKTVSECPLLAVSDFHSRDKILHSIHIQHPVLINKTHLRKMRIRLSDRRKSRCAEAKNKNTAGYHIPNLDIDQNYKRLF